MKASRKSKVITNATPPEDHGWMGTLRRQANNILTLALVVAAIAMLIRWRMRAAENAKLLINNQLLSAQTQVSQLRYIQFSNLPPEDMIKEINVRENAANNGISSVLNSSDADVRMRAEALIARGDMYWYVANLPPSPGSSTQPSWRLNDSASALLQKSWDAYEEVLKNSTYADQSESLAIAHLGVAAIAENRADWPAAKTELEAVANDSKAMQVLVTNAKMQLRMLPQLQNKMYLIPPTEGTMEGTPNTVFGPPVPVSIQATQPTTQPAMTAPPTLPATPPMAQIIHAMTPLGPFSPA